MGTVRKHLAGLVICSVLASQSNFIFTGNTTAAATSTVTKKGTVTASSLNVRSANNTSAKVIGSVKKGTGVTIYDTKNGWYQIGYGSTKGWVSGDYVKLAATTPAKPAAVSRATVTVASTSTSTKKGTVTASTLNVRSSNNAKAKKIGSVKKGTIVTIYAAKSGWYQIAYGNTKGWVSGDYVKLAATTPAKPAAPASVSRATVTVAATKKGTVTASSLNVRSANNTSAKVIGSVKKGTGVTIYDTKNGWYQIGYGNTKGWVSDDYVKLVATSTPKPSAPAKPASNTKKGTVTVSSLNVRSSNSASAKKIGTLTKNSTVTIYASKNGWYQIGYGNTKGWVSGDYVKLVATSTPKPATRTLHTLEWPTDNLKVNNTNITIKGWSVHSSGIKQVKVLLDNKYLGNAKLGIVKKDVQKLYPNYPGSGKSGYYYVIPVNSVPAGKHTITIQSIAKNGSVQSKTISLTIIKPTPKVVIKTPSNSMITTKNTVKISGYALHGSGVKDCIVKVDGKLQKNVTTDVKRSDIQKHYPQYPNSLHSGFEFVLDISQWNMEQHIVEVKIVGNDGTFTSNRTKMSLPGVNFMTYANSLNYYVDLEYPFAVKSFNGEWVSLASRTDPKQTEQYKLDRGHLAYLMNPQNFINNIEKKFMFLKLNFYLDKITAQQQNQIISQFDTLLKGKGILENKGAVYLEAGKQADVNPIYLISHSLLETGNGNSILAKGVKISEVLRKDANGKIYKEKVNPCTVYNMYGIGAYDSDPIGWGTTKAYDEKWYTPDKALIGGANWIGNGYINSKTNMQYTLYKMRWNLENPYHQYATDWEWAIKQTGRIKTLIDQMENPLLQFEIPLFSN